MKKIIFRIGLMSWMIMSLWAIVLQPAVSYAAKPLTADQLQDLTDNPNWVGECGITAASTFGTDPDETSVTTEVDEDKSDKAPDSYKFRSAGIIPKSGVDVKASIFGGKYQGDKFVPTNDKQNPGGANNDDNGSGNTPEGIAGKAGYAELSISPNSRDFRALGGLPNGTKLLITYKGKSVVAAKLDVGAGGEEKPKIDLWWETAKLLDFKDGLDTVTIHALPNDTKTTPVDGAAKETGDTLEAYDQVQNIECCPVESGGSNAGASVATSKDVKENQKAIFSYFLGKGLSKEQAAGILGNIQTESAGTFNPEIKQGGGFSKDPRSVGSSGYGLVQFTPGEKLLNIIRNANLKGEPYEIQTQIDAVWAQLTGKAGANNENPEILKQIKATTNVKDATWAFMGSNTSAGGDGRFIGYERPQYQDEGHLAPRVAAAKAFLTEFGGLAPSEGSVSTPSSGNVCCPPGGTIDTTQGNADDEAPSEWKKMYTGANKAKVEKMGRGPIKPKILVIHYTVGPQEGQALLDFFNTQVTGIQFNVGKDGQIYQYFPLNAMQKTNHVGATNGKAIGIEITGKDVNDIINNEKQFNAVVSLAKTLCDKYKIPCSEPKGDITGDGVSNAQGMLGHDETPGNDHSDPDATVAQATTGGVPRDDSSKHPYMMKLRKTMGFDETPGKKGGSATGEAASTDNTSDLQAQCAASNADTSTGGGTDKDPVGDGENRSLAVEAVKYDTKANNGKYTYLWGGGHGPLSQLENFDKNGGALDCTGFIRFVIWKVYGNDLGGFTTHTIPSMKEFKKIDAKDVQAGDVGWRSGHVDFITENKGGGKLHQFGAHSKETDLYGGDTTADKYEAYYRYVGPKGSADRE